MRRIKLLGLIGLAGLLVQACATMDGKYGAPQPIGTVTERGHDLWQSSQDEDGRVWTALYPARSELVLVTPDGERLPIVQGDASAPSGIALTPAAEGGMRIAYRSKEPVRGVYVASSERRQEVAEVSGDSLALARMLMEQAPGGGVDVLWYGEKAVPEAPDQPHWLYFNRLGPDGKTGAADRVLPGIYPAWIHEGSEIAVFSWYKDKAGDKIAMRLRSADGVFGPERELARVPPVAPPLATFVSNGRWFVYWVSQYGELMDDFLIEGAYSDDRGKNWTRFGLEGLRKLDVGAIQPATDGAGRIALAISGRYREGPADSWREDAYLLTSTDNGTTWSAPVHLRGEKGEGTRAPNVKAAYVGKDRDRLLVVVEDWRTIRPEIRYWLGAPDGSAWEQAGAALKLAADASYQLGYADRTIYPHDNEVVLMLEQLDDTLKDRTIVKYSTTVGALQSGVNVKQPSAPDLERLKARVNAYGKTLVAKDYEGAYELFDPFYRARVEYEDHLRAQGRITYKVAEYGDAALDGNVADVKFHIVASVPKFKRSSGKEIEVPERDVTIDTRWLWIDGDWYMEYYSHAQDLRFTRY